MSSAVTSVPDLRVNVSRCWNKRADCGLAVGLEPPPPIRLLRVNSAIPVASARDTAPEAVLVSGFRSPSSLPNWRQYVDDFIGKETEPSVFKYYLSPPLKPLEVKRERVISKKGQF